ncbi:hypothetical protein chiPu_0021443 [Chiloscyllium punctatum]|uniref:Uncharacterized protein n=1 Tax=Chiloscyllium punctatum TaxID=137246 RepID=A0A401RFC0_CHIPU|nr:hypothetical protein [Chiloscyllium punctatum]
MNKSLHDRSCKAGPESAEALSRRIKITSDKNLTDAQVLSCSEHFKQEGMNEAEKLSRSVSPSISVDDEISERLWEEYSPSCGSVHSEQLVDLTSPTEKSRNEEQSDASNEEQIPMPSHSPSPCRTPTAMLSETDELPESQIGKKAQFKVSFLEPESEEIHEEHVGIKGEEFKDNREDSEDFKGDGRKSSDSKASPLVDMLLSSFVNDAIEQLEEIMEVSS